MNMDSKTTMFEMKIKLSALWTVVLFNMTFRDFHEFLRAGYLEEMLAMTSNGAQVSQSMLIASALVLQIPIGMIFLTHVLGVRMSRWVNIIGAIIMIVGIIAANLTPDPDDVIFFTVACAAMVTIIWYTWKWTEAYSEIHV